MSELSDRFNALAGKIESENASHLQVAEFVHGLVEVARVVGPAVLLARVPGAAPFLPAIGIALSAIDSASQSNVVSRSDLADMARAAADLVAKKA